MKCKKGFFLVFYLLVVFSLMVSVIIILFGNRPDVDDDARLGQMVFDIYDVSIEADKYSFFIRKVGEYSLLGSMKEVMEKGLNNENCLVFYSEGCIFEPEKIVDSFASSVGSHFDKYVTRVSSENFTFDTSFNGEFIFLNGESDAKLNFAENPKKMNFTKDLDFEVSIKYDFSWYKEMEDSLRLNLICLEHAKDEQQVDNIAEGSSGRNPPECLMEYPKFSEITKKNNVLSFNYGAEGYLFEDSFNVPLAVDLGGFRDKVMGNIA